MRGGKKRREKWGGIFLEGVWESGEGKWRGWDGENREKKGKIAKITKLPFICKK